MGTNKKLLETASPATPHGTTVTQTLPKAQPRPECHWTIHHPGDEYEALPDILDDDPNREYDIEHESTWPKWSSGADANIQ